MYAAKWTILLKNIQYLHVVFLLMLHMYMLLVKSLGSVIIIFVVFLKEITTFIQQGCIKLIKSGKAVYIVAKDLYVI